MPASGPIKACLVVALAAPALYVYGGLFAVATQQTAMMDERTLTIATCGSLALAVLLCGCLIGVNHRCPAMYELLPDWNNSLDSEGNETIEDPGDKKEFDLAQKRVVFTVCGILTGVCILLVPILFSFEYVLAPQPEKCEFPYNGTVAVPECKTQIEAILGKEQWAEVYEFSLRSYGFLLGFLSDGLLSNLLGVDASGDFTADISDIIDLWTVRGQEVLDIKEGKKIDETLDWPKVQYLKFPIMLASLSMLVRIVLSSFAMSQFGKPFWLNDDTVKDQEQKTLVWRTAWLSLICVEIPFCCARMILIFLHGKPQMIFLLKNLYCICSDLRKVSEGIGCSEGLALDKFEYLTDVTLEVADVSMVVLDDEDDCVDEGQDNDDGEENCDK